MVVLSARGFEIMIMDGQTCEGIRIPVLNTQAEPALAPIAKRIESAKPLGIFRARSNVPGPGPAEAEFLLCYNGARLPTRVHSAPLTRRQTLGSTSTGTGTCRARATAGG